MIIEQNWFVCFFPFVDIDLTKNEACLIDWTRDGRDECIFNRKVEEPRVTKESRLSKNQFFPLLAVAMIVNSIVIIKVMQCKSIE